MRKRLTLAALGAVLVLYTVPLFGQTQPLTPTGASATVPGTIALPAPGTATTQAIPVTTVPSPAAPTNPIDQLIWAGVASYLLRYFTQKKWFPVLTPESSSRLKTQIGFVVALATAAGVHMAVNGSFFSSEGVGVTLTGFSAHAVKDVGFQWLSQQAWWDVIVKKVSV